MPNTTIETVMSVVRTGRRMQVSDIVMSRADLLALRHSGSVRKEKLAVGYYHLPFGNPRLDDGYAVNRALHLDRTNGRHIVLHHEHEGTRLTELESGRRNGDRVLDSQGQLRAHERARPEHLVLVRHGRPDGHHAGREIDHVLDHRDLAGRARASSGNDCLQRRRLGGERLSNIRQAALRNGEGHVDRRRLVDGGERGEIRLPNEIADLDRCHAGAAGDRGANAAIAQLNIEIFELPGVGGDRSAVDIDLRHRVVEGDLGSGALGVELGVARNVALGLLEVRLRTVEYSLHLLDLRLDRAAVERKQEIASPHHRAVAEMHAHDLRIDARLDRDTGDRSDAAERLDTNRDGFLHRGRDLDRCRPRRGLPLRLRDRAARPQSAAYRRDNADCRKRRDPPEHQRAFLHYLVTMPSEAARAPLGLPFDPGAPPATILPGMPSVPSNISMLTVHHSRALTV